VTFKWVRRDSGVFWPATPMMPRRTRPWRRSWLTTNLAVSIEVAKQMPCAAMMIAVFTPMTSPLEETSGPPELPGFNAASV